MKHSYESVMLDSGNILIPKWSLVFDPWQGTPIADTYGGKTVLDYKGEPLFAELAILRLLNERGYSGVWVDTYRKRFRTSLAGEPCRLESHAEKAFELIARANGNCRNGCWDILCWKEGKFLFVEAKRKHKDSLRKSQINWLQAALKAGFFSESFLICEWELQPRPTRG